MSEICAVLNVHREGILAHSSLLSMLEAKAVAEEAQIAVEIMVVADCADGPTREYLQTARRLGARTLDTDFADVGLARNAAAAACDSKYLALLDGDDLWASNWLKDAHVAASREERPVIWHPEASLYFGSGVEPYWVSHPDMDDDPDCWLRLGLYNLWTSLAFASRDIVLQVPYGRTDLRSQFGYEDWRWNADASARGFIHKTVPGTAHLIRVTADSLMRRTGATRALMLPTDLFRLRCGHFTAHSNPSS